MCKVVLATSPSPSNAVGERQQAPGPIARVPVHAVAVCLCTAPSLHHCPQQGKVDTGRLSLPLSTQTLYQCLLSSLELSASDKPQSDTRLPTSEGFIACSCQNTGFGSSHFKALTLCRSFQDPDRTGGHAPVSPECLAVRLMLLVCG